MCTGREETEDWLVMRVMEGETEIICFIDGWNHAACGLLAAMHAVYMRLADCIDIYMLGTVNILQ